MRSALRILLAIYDLAAYALIGFAFIIAVAVLVRAF